MIGVINLNKPSGMTSNDAVVKVRGILRRQTGEKLKVGHYGTLDPLATGVLPIAVGKATKLFDLMCEKVKVYRAAFVFGSTTDTLDGEGQITATGGRIPEKEEIVSVLPALIGEIDQVPPAYSAKSIDGVRAYDLARKGKVVELPAKKVNIYDIKLLSGAGSEYQFEITCGAGTYIRAIARDMANQLGTIAYMSALTREKSGAFSLDKAVTFEDLEREAAPYVLPLDFALSGFKRFELPEEYADKILNGVKIELNGMPDGKFAVIRAGIIIGIGENSQGCLRIGIRL